MRFPKKESVESIRREYPVGTRIELLEMLSISLGIGILVIAVVKR